MKEKKKKDETAKSNKFVDFFKKVGVRFQLLGIWSLKNIGLIIKLGIFLVVVLIIAGVITGYDEFVTQVGASLYGIAFGAGAGGAVLVAVAILFWKSKPLAVGDIKSRNLKIAMIRANLYFNEKGRLSKKVIDATNMDVNNDGKIDETDVNQLQEERLITGVFRAGSELITILSTPIDLEAGQDKIIEEETLSDNKDDEQGIIKVTTKEDPELPVEEEKPINEVSEKKEKTDDDILAEVILEEESKSDEEEKIEKEKKIIRFHKIREKTKLFFKKILDGIKKIFNKIKLLFNKEKRHVEKALKASKLNSKELKEREKEAKLQLKLEKLAEKEKRINLSIAAQTSDKEYSAEIVKAKVIEKVVIEPIKVEEIKEEVTVEPIQKVEESPKPQIKAQQKRIEDLLNKMK